MAGPNPGMVVRVAANLEDLRAGMREATGIIHTTADALAEMVTRFNGDKLIQQAHTVVAAVNEIGGATALTAREQAEANRIVTEAIAKYAALGDEAPADMVALATATKQAQEETKGFGISLQAAGSFVGNLAADIVMKLGTMALDGVKALASGLAELIVAGSGSAGVTENFERMAAQAGILGSTLLGVLREGTHATVTEFELIKTANAGLAAGLRLSEEQWRTLAQGAYALAQATGEDVATALGKMTDAMITGKTNAIELKFGMIDNTAALDAYAAAHGTTRDKLNETQRLEVAREEILRRVGDATQRVGEQTDGLAEILQQASVWWADFKKHLGESIERSGVLTAGLRSLKESILAAFGGDEQALIQAVTRFINNVAIAVVDAALVMVEWGKTAASAFGLMKGPIDALTVAINYVVTGFLDGLTKVYEIAAKIPGIGSEYAQTAAQLRTYADSWREVRDRTVEQMHADDEMARGKSRVHDVLNGVTTALVSMKSSMVEASLTTQQATPLTVAHATALDAQTTATNATAAATRQFNIDFAKFNEYQRDHTKYGPEVLISLGQMEKKVQDVGIATDADMRKWHDWEEAHTKRGPEILLGLGTMERKLTDVTKATSDAAGAQEIWNSGLVFSAETIGEELAPAIAKVEQQVLSFSDAMDAVRRGEGTMTGTIGKATKPAGMSEMEFQQMQRDPRTWEIMHGWDWQSPGGTGSTWAWLDQMAPYPSSKTTNINVSTVMGNPNEIARVVKDALASDYRSSGGRV